MSKRKVLVIDNADHFTTESSNALLKQLEEPKPGTLVILISSLPYKILPTVRSRLQKVPFGYVDEADYAGIFLQNDPVSESDKSWIKKVSKGTPGLAARLLGSPEFMAEHKEVEEFLTKFQSADEVERMILLGELAQKETPEPEVFVKALLKDGQARLLKNPSKQAAKATIALSSALELLSRSTNTSLTLTNLAINY
jgi:DNA polymerase-3 subunit delta'